MHKIIKYLLVFFISLAFIFFARQYGIIKNIKHNMEYFYISSLNYKSYDISKNPIKKPQLIQHAGGGIGDMTYTNSLEALNKNYAEGERFFELDFDITSDGVPVVIHGWEQMNLYKNGEIGKQYTSKEFISFKRKDKLTQMNIDILANWLETHEGSYIITDVKSDNVKVLSTIASKYPSLKNRFVPQIYKLRQYSAVRELGFEDIILTLYASEYSDEIVLGFASQYPLFAVTMWDTRVLNGTLAKKLKQQNITVYAHTVNKWDEVQRLKAKGAFGVYTDFLKERGN